MAIDEKVLKEHILKGRRLWVKRSSQTFVPLRIGKWQGIKMVKFEVTNKDRSVEVRAFDLTFVLNKFYKTNVNF